MKLALPLTSILLTLCFISAGIFICYYYFNGPAFFFAFPIFSAIILITTFITQLILLILLKKYEKQVYRFFYYFCLTASIMLTGIYVLLSLILLSLKKMTEAMDNMYPDGDEFTETNSISPFFYFHLVLLIPIIIQVFLIVLRQKRVKKMNILIGKV